MASDGVFDNLYDPDVIECVTPYMTSTLFTDPQASSDCIAEKSFKLGNSQGFVSPFAVGARAAGRNYPDQGKSDDIAVITAQIHTKGKGPEGYPEYQEIDTNGIGMKPDDGESTSAESTKDDL